MKDFNTILKVKEGKTFEVKDFFNDNQVDGTSFPCARTVSSIDRLIDWLQAQKTAGATHFCWDCAAYDGDREDLELRAVYLTMETEQQTLDRRAASEASAKRRKDATDRAGKKLRLAEYKKLQEEFGDIGMTLDTPPKDI